MKNRTYFEKRIDKLMERLKLPDNWEVHLHSYMPGDRKLYQVQIVHKDSQFVHISLPRHMSLNSHEFELYLNGLFDSTNLEGFWRKI